MGNPEPSGSFAGWIPAMDPRQLGVSPGSGGSGSNGNGVHSAVYTSSRRRRRMSSPSTGTRLMPQFNAAVDGGGFGSSSSSSSGGLDLGLDESHNRQSRQRAHPEASPAPNHTGRLLLLSPAGSPATTDDDVLIMDGVLVDNNRSGARRSASFVDNNVSGTDTRTRRSASFVANNLSGTASGTRRSVTFVDNNVSGTPSGIRLSASFSDPGYVSSGSPGSSGSSNRCGFNGQEKMRNLWAALQGGEVFLTLPIPSSGLNCLNKIMIMKETNQGCRFAQGREEPRGMQAMRPRFSEVESPSSWPVLGAGLSNIQGSPITPPRLPPSLPGPGPVLPTAAPRGPGPAVTVRPPAPYFTPPRVTVPAARPGPSPAPPRQPETPPPRPPPPRTTTTTTTFAWPPTAEEDASISASLYGSSASGRPRLPVFRAICPAD
ncbi:hypothetical protein ACP70R_048927 [Stipagrostis hirtigluma subsp. patula]